MGIRGRKRNKVSRARMVEEVLSLWDQTSLTMEEAVSSISNEHGLSENELQRLYGQTTNEASRQIAISERS